MADDLEREIKLKLPAKDFSKLLSHEGIKKVMLPNTLQKSKLENRYFDTEDYKLYHAGLAYRIRKNANGYTATLKTNDHAEGGFSARGEYNVTVKDFKPDLRIFQGHAPEELTEDLFSETALVTLFKTTVRRTTCLLKPEEGSCLEMAIDTGTISAGKKKEKIEEVEFEIKEGNEAALFTFVAGLAAQIPLFSEARSKFRRGIDLLSNNEVVKEPLLPKVKLLPDTSAEEGIKNLLKREIGKIIDLQSFLMEQKGTEEFQIKKLVTSLGRLRALVVLFRPLWTEEEYTSFVNRLDTLYLPLLHYRALKHSLKIWKKVLAAAGDSLNNSVLRRTLKKLLAEVQEEILGLVSTGKYNQLMFSFLAGLEKIKWNKAEFVELAPFIGSAYRSWQKDFAELGRTEFKQKAQDSLSLFQLIEIPFVLKDLLKMLKISKNDWYELKTRYGWLQTLYFDECVSLEMTALLKRSSSKLLYRDVGILRGWQLIGRKEAGDKAGKAFGRKTRKEKSIEDE